MTIKNPQCEWCGAVGLVHPHHLWPRNIAAGGRLNIRINLIGLCSVCHNDVQAGLITRIDLLAVVANREGMMQDQIEAEIWRLRKEPDHAPA